MSHIIIVFLFFLIIIVKGVSLSILVSPQSKAERRRFQVVI